MVSDATMRINPFLQAQAATVAGVGANPNGQTQGTTGAKPTQPPTAPPAGVSGVPATDDWADFNKTLAAINDRQTTVNPAIAPNNEFYHDPSFMNKLAGIGNELTPDVKTPEKAQNLDLMA